MPLSRVNAFFKKRSTRFCLLSLFLVALLVATWYFLIPTSEARFLAQVDTRTLMFQLGHLNENAGIFNSDSRRVNMVIGQVRVVAGDGSSSQCDSGAQLRGVKMAYQETASGEGVALYAEPNGLVRFRFTPHKSAAVPYLTVQFDEKSDLQGLSCLRMKPKTRDGELQIFAPAPDIALEFWVDFSALPLGAKQDKKHPTTGPDDETGIPLADGSTLYFQGSEGLVGSGSELVMFPSERKVQLEQGLIVDQLKSVVISTLHFDPKDNFFHAEVAGQAKSINVKFGDAEETEKEIRLPIHEWGSLGEDAVWLAPILGSLLTLYGMILQIQHGWMQHEDRKEFDSQHASTSQRDKSSTRVIGRKKR
jgi:hypothetical protein